MSDCISRQAAIDALNLADDRGEIRSVMDAVGALKALPPVFPNLDEIQMEIYVSGYEKGANESLAAVLNAFKKVRDELPEDKREEYTDDFCKIMGRMLDELEKKE